MMEMPLFSVEDDTNCSVPKPQSLSNVVPSYAGLLDSLINTLKVAATLEKRCMIESMLGQDDEVADLFNIPCQGTYLNYEQHSFAHLFKDVKQYSEISPQVVGKTNA